VNVYIIINTSPFFGNSASSNRWRTLIEGLANLGVQISLLIYGGYKTEQEARIYNGQGEKNGISIKYISPKLIKGYCKQRYYTYIGFDSEKSKISRLILKELENKEGFVWTESSHFGFQMAVKIKSEQSEKLLFIEMSEYLDIHKNNSGNFLQSWKANQRQMYFKWKAYNAYNGIALMTKTLIDHFKNCKTPHTKFLHLPMTVDLDRFSEISEPPKEFIKPYIAFVGVMNDVKDGVNVLIQSFSKISHDFPHHKLYLIGPWGYDTPIHLKMIKEHGLTDRVFWMEEYPRDIIPSIIMSADLLVLPRPHSKQAQGGFPTKLGEYLATGNPVCATIVGEIPDYLKDRESVYFAEPGSVKSFAEAMQCALSNPQEAKRIGVNGRKVAEVHFNKDIQAKKLYDFLLSLTQE